MNLKDQKEIISVLHFDDNPYELEAVERLLQLESFGPQFIVKSCGSIEAAKASLSASSVFDLVLLDLYDERKDLDVGFEMIQEVRKRHKNAVIVMRSSSVDPRSVVKSLQMGADDFISKKTERAELSLRLFNALHLGRLKRGVPEQLESNILKRSVVVTYGGETMRKIAMRVPKIIDSAIMAVHVYGEPGTGKEVVADLFAAYLPSGKPFVRVHCGGIAPALLESELFGVVKGAFTGATSDRSGLIEEADGGWLFLDEVATLPPPAQVAMLRVLENREIKPVGSGKTKTVNVRILSATNESLEDLVAAGKFRKDLWQRLVEAQVELPPLRDRAGEIENLALSICGSMKGGPYEITHSAIGVLKSLSWRQGNVRELRNCLRAMTELCENKTLTPLSIPSKYCADLKIDAGGRETSNAELSNRDIKDTLIVKWRTESATAFEDAADQMLKLAIEMLFAEHRRLTLRSLSRFTGIAKTTLGQRLRKLVAKDILTADQLKEMVGLTLDDKNVED